MKTQTFANKVIGELFEHGNVKINPKNPWTWASGWKSPIYVNLRNIMSQPRLRSDILNLMSDVILENKLQDSFDIIIGTSTAGIWIGKLLADRFEKPFIILKDGQAQKEVLGYWDLLHFFEKSNKDGKITSIISSSPEAISIAISIAERKHLPFGYIRRESKKHGDPVLIEGNIIGGKTFLVDVQTDQNYLEHIKEILTKSEIEVQNSYIWNPEKNSTIVDIAGKKTLIVEDLVSTGNSGIKEGELARTLGAEVLNEVSIFNYGFPESEKRAHYSGIKIHSAINGKELIETGVESRFINSEDQNVLYEFFSNPSGWGEKNGFTGL